MKLRYHWLNNAIQRQRIACAPAFLCNKIGRRRRSISYEWSHNQWIGFGAGLAGKGCDNITHVILGQNKPTETSTTQMCVCASARAARRSHKTTTTTATTGKVSHGICRNEKSFGFGRGKSSFHSSYWCGDAYVLWKMRRNGNGWSHEDVVQVPPFRFQNLRFYFSDLILLERA